MADIFQIVENNGTPKDIGDSKARADIAENFSTSKSYVVGDYCLYEGVLYRFTSSHTGSWNNSHVTSVNLADDKVRKSGDTMTGHLFNTSNIYVKRADWNNSAASVESNAYGSFGFVDNDNAYIGYVQSSETKSGEDYIQLSARKKVSGDNVDNCISLGVKADGTPTVTISNNAITKWLSALDLADSGWQTATPTKDNNNNDVYTGTIKYRKIGKIVYVSGFDITGFGTSSITLTNIPSGYRPLSTLSTERDFPFIELYNKYTVVGIVRIYSGGSLNITPETGTNFEPNRVHQFHAFYTTD